MMKAERLLLVTLLGLGAVAIASATVSPSFSAAIHGQRDTGSGKTSEYCVRSFPLCLQTVGSSLLQYLA